MILEAFSQHLKSVWNVHYPSEQILCHWLHEQLQRPVVIQDPILHVLSRELVFICKCEDSLALQCFLPKSNSGERLLASLAEYCRSYEQWQFSRWAHTLKASDFKRAKR